MLFRELFNDAIVKHDITGRDLARRIRVSPTSISLWRTGQTYPRVNHLRKLCEVFPEWDLDEVQSVINEEKLVDYKNDEKVISPFNELVPLFRGTELLGHHSLPRAFGATQRSELYELADGSMALVHPSQSPADTDTVAIRVDSGKVTLATSAKIENTRFFLGLDGKPIGTVNKTALLGVVVLKLIKCS